MSASLVGSEMCIRDRLSALRSPVRSEVKLNNGASEFRHACIKEVLAESCHPGTRRQGASEQDQPSGG
eukprot:8782744-Alexandrium_andersonii.AAC.1